ncbi:MAG: hypothetical protein ACTSR8_09890 [Promethearchaeota archaeon]
MKLQLSDLNNGSVFIGDKLGVRTIFNFDEVTSILWSGIRLLTIPPCHKQELQIAKEEIFTMGKFEKGEYIRDKALLIKNNVVPTIKKRNLEYRVELVFRTENPINSDEDLVVKRTHPIEIKVKDEMLKAQPPNPISFSISGLTVNLNKDIYKPGETIKINYKSQNLKELEIRLLQSANIICYCQPYGQNCRNVEDLPPAIAGDAKKSNPDEGYVLLKVPEVAEPTHNYLYQASDKERWGMKLGDYTNWSLLILGKKKPEYGRDIIKFEVPITIAAKAPFTEAKPDINLFSKESTGGLNIFDEISSKLQKRFQLISISSEAALDSGDRLYIMKIKNISKEDLKGITIKLSGLQEGLFETRAELIGLNSWNKEEEKELLYKTKQDISAIISIIEDNSQKRVRIQTPISF